MLGRIEMKQPDAVGSTNDGGGLDEVGGHNRIRRSALEKRKQHKHRCLQCIVDVCALEDFVQDGKDDFAVFQIVGESSDSPDLREKIALAAS